MLPRRPMRRGALTLLRRSNDGHRRTWRQEWDEAPPYMRAMVLGTATVCGVFVVSHIETMPHTGRRRLMFLSHAAEEQLGERAYQEILRSERLLPSTHPMSRTVARVGAKIVETSNEPRMKWRFHVIDSPEPNAFCLPGIRTCNSQDERRSHRAQGLTDLCQGGKVFVHTGLFKILSNEDTLAAVMFHEAAHGVARHGAEKVSFSLLVYGLLAFLLPDFGQLGDLVVHLAVDLPFSRKLELEADSLGLRLMAKACYDPRASLQMHAALGKLHERQPPKYFSTHPPSEERMQAARRQLRDAMTIYETSGCFERKEAFHQLTR
ncbi:hypothetical protein PINS_up011767 [Pythium insidiosum]|nr:hypothetical protein PINS_up011767 [Pythium insidiosum]